MASTSVETQSRGNEDADTVRSSRTSIFSKRRAVREERQQYYKDEDIRRARKFAERLLQPRPFTRTEQKRLEELKALRIKRQIQYPNEGDDESCGNTSRSSSSSSNDSFNHHHRSVNSLTTAGSCDDTFASPMVRFSSRAFGLALGPFVPASLSWRGSKRDVTEPQSGSPSVTPSVAWSRRMTDKLRGHSRITRCAVMAVLLSFFFVLLNPEMDAVIGKYFSTSFVASNTVQSEGAFNMSATSDSFLVEETVLDMPQYSMSWFGGVFHSTFWAAAGYMGVQDLARFLHMIALALVHFAICDISTIYAFDALNVASIRGHEVRRYYTEFVRERIFLGSFSILSISIAKAWARVLVNAIWSSSIALLRQLHDHGIAPDANQVFSGPNYKWSDKVAPTFDEGVAMLERSIPKDTFQLIMRSVGLALNLFGMLFRLSWGTIDSMQRPLLRGVAGVVRFAENNWFANIEDRMWRTEAFDMARLFYSYSAVFLVVLLLLFNMWASLERSRVSVASSKKKKY